ncbi:unnamed protein product [Mesocestoides corti]|uniref:Uncharacterized protein n=1 Tax=Mesocestoides corti TaxID=53468 RepID=A0A0R3UE12_MESCO|nr:unnamed protein product [Mesocestoides corti]
MVISSSPSFFAHLDVNKECELQGSSSPITHGDTGQKIAMKEARAYPKGHRHLPGLIVHRPSVAAGEPRRGETFSGLSLPSSHDLCGLTPWTLTHVLQTNGVEYQSIGRGSTYAPASVTGADTQDGNQSGRKHHPLSNRGPINSSAKWCRSSFGAHLE